MTQEQQQIVRAAMLPTEMGEVIASRTMKRLRPGGVLDTVAIEIGVPYEIPVPYGDSEISWMANVRISLVPRILAMQGESSLDAILNATYLAATVLKGLPFASEIDMSLLPNFNLPMNPVTTTPEQLAAEQQRPKAIRVHEISAATTQAVPPQNP